MAISIEDVIALEILENRLRLLLPEQYQDSYEDLTPVPMRSAGLKYDEDGRVAWDEIWATFCDLAMAGGPPHRGSLLQPGFREDVESNSDQYPQVVEEICRGIGLVTKLPACTSLDPGWIRVDCPSVGMAGWLVRAIVMENVLARHQRETLYLPAAPGFRLEKEIKNVITVMAKTCHYWTGHVPPEQQRSIEELLERMNAESPLLGPGTGLESEISRNIEQKTGFRSVTHPYRGWIGIECPSVRAALWMMRAMVGSNVLARREGTVLFLPVNETVDPHGESLVSTLVRIHQLASIKKIV